MNTTLIWKIDCKTFVLHIHTHTHHYHLCRHLVRWKHGISRSHCHNDWFWDQNSDHDYFILYFKASSSFCPVAQLRGAMVAAVWLFNIRPRKKSCVALPRLKSGGSDSWQTFFFSEFFHTLFLLFKSLKWVANSNLHLNFHWQWNHKHLKCQRIV